MARKSFIEYSSECQFPIQNLPWGIFSTSSESRKRVGVAIGPYVLDMVALTERFELPGVSAELFQQDSLNAYIQTPRSTWKLVREKLSYLLDSETASDLRDDEEFRQRAFVPLDQVHLHLPLNVGDYTDFYASREHAYNCGVIIRGKDNALQPNWTHLPVGYHGRSSTIVPSGTSLRRPHGQRKSPSDASPVFGPCTRLDYELEMGYVIGGAPNELGRPVTTAEAPERLFGMVILNDWSARDIQTWEYVPLGPFLSKNFGSTISPWVVEFAALEPFAQRPTPAQRDTPVLPYLRDPDTKAYDVNLKVEIKPSSFDNYAPVAHSNLKHIYWTPSQFVAHHTITGCTLRAGDLFGTGTLSAPEEEQADEDGGQAPGPGDPGFRAARVGSLLEKSWAGQRPFRLEVPAAAAAAGGRVDGEREGALEAEGGNGVTVVERTWLEDGDSVRMTAWCQGDRYVVGFGEAVGTILPALELNTQ